jgi:putative flippase GtrA
MTVWTRWAKFNAVGVVGMGLQLALLSALNRRMGNHILDASAAAVEITLLHNFAWHWHYTWRDRRMDISPAAALVRFHLSNGMVSMLGNLALMQLLVREARLPLLLANSIAIACCSIANFFLGNQWAFAATDCPCKAPAAEPRR